MKIASLTLPEIAAIAGTRVAFGAGVGLLCGELLQQNQRRQLGWALLGIGAAATVPLLADVLMKLEPRPVPARIANHNGKAKPARRKGPERDSAAT